MCDRLWSLHPVPVPAEKYAELSAFELWSAYSPTLTYPPRKHRGPISAVDSQRQRRHCVRETSKNVFSMPPSARLEISAPKFPSESHLQSDAVARGPLPAGDVGWLHATCDFDVRLNC
jgi:hypothetical protein